MRRIALLSGFGILLAASVMNSCDTVSVEPSATDTLSVTVVANVTDLDVAAVTVEVSAADIATPILVALTVDGGLASGTVVVPTGSNRTFTVRAFNADGIETHNGTTTANVPEGGSITLLVTVEPVLSEVVISVLTGSAVVSISPEVDTLVVGDTVRFSATVLTAQGEEVTDPVLSWASTDPGVAVVDSSGLASATGVGVASVVVVARGTAAAARIVVQ